MINVFQPLTGDEEIIATADVLASNWLGKGPKVTQFESAWAAHIGVNPEQVFKIKLNYFFDAIYNSLVIFTIIPQLKNGKNETLMV